MGRIVFNPSVTLTFIRAELGLGLHLKKKEPFRGLFIYDKGLEKLGLFIGQFK